MEIIDIDDKLPASQEAKSMLVDLTRQEIDIQVSTAHAYPRKLTLVARNILGLATLNHAAAHKCMYALPRGNKPITGPSIRLAEIVFSQWGNCRGGARVVHVDKDNGFVEAEGIFHDLETNAATIKKVRRRIFDKNGKCFNDDMILVTGNAACSIAFRNAVLSGVPEALWGEAYETALRTIKGDTKTLAERKEAALQAMAAFGMKPEQVYQILGIEGDRDMNLDTLVHLSGMHNSLKEGETTVEELLSLSGTGGAKPKRKIAAGNKEPKPEKEPVADAKPTAAEMQAAKEAAQKEMREQEAAQEVVETATKHVAAFDSIINDMMDATHPTTIDELLEMHGATIAQMQGEEPEMHKELLEQAEAFKKALS